MFNKIYVYVIVLICFAVGKLTEPAKLSRSRRKLVLDKQKAARKRGDKLV